MLSVLSLRAWAMLFQPEHSKFPPKRGKFGFASVCVGSFLAGIFQFTIQNDFCSLISYDALSYIAKDIHYPIEI
jgi:hypothetical protein